MSPIGTFRTCPLVLRRSVIGAEADISILSNPSEPPLISFRRRIHHGAICATPSSSEYLNWRDEVDFNATPGDSREGQKAIRPTFEATLNAVARFEIEITRSADALAEF